MIKKLPAALRNRAKKIRLIAMDVDGVLTSGDIILLRSGEEVKPWSVKDRFAYTLLRKSPLKLKLAWITGRKSEEVTVRAKELRIDFLFDNCAVKLEALDKIKAASGLGNESIAYIGDDWIDAPVLMKAGFSACPKDAPDEIRKICHYTSRYEGGRGVFRDVLEIILSAQNAYEEVARIYGL